MRYEESVIEGRNVVLEALRSGQTIDKIFVLDGCMDGPVRTIVRDAKKQNILINFVKKERLDQMSETGKHQGVIAYIAAYDYASVDDIMNLAKEKGEDPFVILLDEIEDPHNLGAIIRTANQAGAHGVIIPKHRAAGLTATVARASAGAINYTPVAKVTNMSATIEALKDMGMWFVCADMGGERMYDLNLKGPIGLVIGNEGKGISPLLLESNQARADMAVQAFINATPWEQEIRTPDRLAALTKDDIVA
ncbi:MAG: 23S rRNA (guanosine(2251)-2'-O)-methyltransferase RlmB, partial [Lachnospiraceae bacterium]|nr:23S rRNA (guanosine(2251)-2'-O)-methyltransferase RlmB [Lachnospiraceae bacterium]